MTQTGRSLYPILFTVLLAIPVIVVAQELPAQEKTQEPAPASGDPCLDQKGLDAWIDRLHSSLYRLTCSSASWFDGLFGNRRYEEDHRGTYGSVTAGTLWSERDKFDKVLRFHARMYLPQLSERFHAFVGRVDREQFVSESKNDLYGLPSAFGRNLDDSVLLGLGYNEPLQKNGSFDADAGVRLQFPLDPYVKGSYRYARPIGQSNLVRFRETIFWENSEKTGTTARVDWDHVVTDHHLARWTASGTLTERTAGVQWYSTLALYQVLSAAKQRALAYEIGLNGSTDAEVPLYSYGATITYRQSAWRDWLLIELRTGVDWPRDTLAAQRRANLNAGLAFEMRYGRQSGRP